jgi:ABC-type branched-subunit amino acid transport system substrate-binding protein
MGRIGFGLGAVAHGGVAGVTLTVITGIDSLKVLDQALQAARTFKPLSKEAVASLLARTSVAAATGKFELFKTGNRYDGTAHNPHWLG